MENKGKGLLSHVASVGTNEGGGGGGGGEGRTHASTRLRRRRTPEVPLTTSSDATAEIRVAAPPRQHPLVFTRAGPTANAAIVASARLHVEGTAAAFSLSLSARSCFFFFFFKSH